MPMLSSLHQLFNADTCHASLHTLRWKDRPLPCPRCQSRDSDPWGNDHDRPGCKRSWGNGCQRPFNDRTNTLLHQSRGRFPIGFWRRFPQFPLMTRKSYMTIGADSSLSVSTIRLRLLM
jgi:hypothetical protein